VKGANTVSKIFSKQISTTTFIRYSEITKVEGSFEIKGVKISTDSPGEYAVVVNVWGIESTYNSPETMYLTIRETLDHGQYAFALLESYIAFLVAFMLILTSSFNFPFWMVPLSLSVLALFLFYVYHSLDTKGSSFVITVFIVVAVNIMGILSDLAARLVCRSKQNSPYFFQQKLLLDREYSF
jgi:hypothetical protein